MFRYLPEQASEIAPKIDWLNNLVTDLSVFFTVAIVGAMIYFAFKYKRTKKHQKGFTSPTDSHFLEVMWTVVPTLISCYILYYGIVYYRELRHVPANPIEINGIGKQWVWDFEYNTGKKTTNEITIPVNKPVKFILTSKDVLHSFFIPAMRVKSDVIPGHYTYVSFTPVKTGRYYTFCTEYCGKDHSAMLAKLNVVSQAEYDRWVNDLSESKLAEKLDLGELGAKLYEEKQCKSCHSLDGTRLVGPSWLKLFGKEEEFEDGTKIQVDENYLRTAILNPNAQIAMTYPKNVMPAYEGQLSEREISALITFIKEQDGKQKAISVKEEVVVDPSTLTPAQRGEMLYKSQTCNACHSIDGSKVVGPSWKGLYGHDGELVTGDKYVADDAYITESILNPNAKIVKGYAPSMPVIPLNDDQIKDIIEYMKTLK